MKAVQFFRKKVTAEDIFHAVDSLLSYKKIIFICIIVFLALFFLTQTLPSLLTWDTDSPSFYIAAKGMRQGLAVYDQSVFQSLAESELGKSVSVYPYIYLPFVAQCFIPLSLLGNSVYFTLLYILNLVFTFGCLFLVYLLLKETGERANRFLLLFLFLLLAYNLPLRATINHGQVNILVFFLILLAFYLLKNDHDYAGSAVLSLAIVFKIYPVLFLFYFLIKKKFRPLSYTLLNLLGLFTISSILFGIRHWMAYIRMNLSSFNGGSLSAFLKGFSSHQDNNSLKAFLSQLFPIADHALVIVITAAALVLIAFLFTFPLRKRIMAEDFPFIGSVIFVLSLMLLPISWSHHYVIMIFPMAYLFREGVSQKKPILLFLSLLISFLVFSYPRYGGFPFNQIRFMGIGLYLIILLSISLLSIKNWMPHHKKGVENG